MLSDTSLLKKLNEFALDDESAKFKFSNRLARENGWSLAFAKSAIAEYKKFVYLAAVSPTPVTPSDVVDQVWHQHLTYSRSYWDEMCGEILRKPLHHGPTRGGGDEDAKYRNLYAATLEAYRREFGEDAPRAFWPSADDHFAGGEQRWVDPRKNLMLSWRTVARTAAAFVGGAIALEGVALAAAAGKTASGASLPLILAGGAFAVVLLLIAAVSGSGKRRRGGGSDTSRDDGSTSFIPFIGSGGSSRDNHHQDGHGHGTGHDGSSHSGGEGGSGGCAGGGGCSSS